MFDVLWGPCWKGQSFSFLGAVLSDTSYVCLKYFWCPIVVVRLFKMVAWGAPWHKSVEKPSQMSEPQPQRPTCPGSFPHWHQYEDRNNLHSLWPQTSQTWKSHSSLSLVIVVAKMMLPASRGTTRELWLAQSFLLEVYIKYLPCPRHWWCSSDMQEEYSLLGLEATPCLAVYQDSAQPSPGRSPALFPLLICPSSCICIHIERSTTVLSAWDCLWLDSDLQSNHGVWFIVWSLAPA